MASKLNYKDYCRLPNDRMIHEIIDGEHFNHPAPRTKHQIIVANLTAILHSFVNRENLGIVLPAPTDVLLGPHDIVQPDLIFISKKNEKIITELNIQGVPDLLIEITSPTDPEFDRETKMKLYGRYRIENYWIVDAQANRLEVNELEAGVYKLKKIWSKGEVFEPTLFPGLRLEISDIFRSY